MEAEKSEFHCMRQWYKANHCRVESDGETLSGIQCWALMAPRGESTRVGTAAGKICQEDKLGKTNTGWFSSHIPGTNPGSTLKFFCLQLAGCMLDITSYFWSTARWCLGSDSTYEHLYKWRKLDFVFNYTFKHHESALSWAIWCLLRCHTTMLKVSNRDNIISV